LLGTGMKPVDRVTTERRSATRALDSAMDPRISSEQQCLWVRDFLDVLGIFYKLID